MDAQRPKTRLVLIPGGLESQEDSPAGPITRMGLWHRFPQPSKVQVGLILAAKVLLLAIAVYLVWR